METPYSKAWQKFSMTHEFVQLVQNSRKDGEDTKYTINRLQLAFNGGWNSKTSSILDVLNAVADKQQQEDKQDGR